MTLKDWNQYWHFYMDIKSKRLSLMIQRNYKKIKHERETNSTQTDRG